MDLKNRLTGQVIFSFDTNKISILVSAAIEAEISLRWADLSGANLSKANLRGARLSGAKNAPVIITYL